MKINQIIAVALTVVMQFVFCTHSMNASEKVENDSEALACRNCENMFCDKCN